MWVWVWGEWVEAVSAELLRTEGVAQTLSQGLNQEAKLGFSFLSLALSVKLREQCTKRSAR